MNNIQCGNALVDSEYYLKSKEELFEDDDARRAINVFDWEKRFASVFANGGFDCVIGNPPYVSNATQRETEKLKLQGKYFISSGHYKTLHMLWDLYIPFMEKSLNILKKSGIYAQIIPYPFTNQAYARLMRELILKEYCLLEIADLKGIKVFSSATVTNCIPIVRKGEEIAGDTVAISHIDKENNIAIAFKKPMSELVIDERTGVWNLEEKRLNNARHTNLHMLGDFCYISKGVCPNADEIKAKGQFKKDDLISETCDDKHPRKYIEAKDYSRYSIDRVRFIEYGTKRSPAKWHRLRFIEWYDIPKIFTNRLGKLKATLDIHNNVIHNDSIIGLGLWKDLQGVDNNSISGSIKKYSHLSRQEMGELSEQVNLYYLLAILNSAYASHLLDIQRGGDYHIYPEHIRRLPIPIAPKCEMDALTTLAKEELKQHALLKEARLESDRVAIQSTIDALDAKIDEIVYAIYGLTNEEIAQLQ